MTMQQASETVDLDPLENEKRNREDELSFLTVKRLTEMAKDTLLDIQLSPKKEVKIKSVMDLEQILALLKRRVQEIS